jgi:hypothetical protein
MKNNETAALMRFLGHAGRTSSDAPRSELKVLAAMMPGSRVAARAQSEHGNSYPRFVT